MLCSALDLMGRLENLDFLRRLRAMEEGLAAGDRNRRDQQESAEKFPQGGGQDAIPDLKRPDQDTPLGQTMI
jgi:hypothetical protein